MKHWKKMAASLIAISTMVAVVPTTYAMESEDSQPQTTDTATVQTTKAAEPTLLASWDFTGKNGTTNSAIADSTGKYNLTLKDGAKIEQYGDAATTRRSHCAAMASTPRSMTSCSRMRATPSLWSSRPRLVTTTAASSSRSSSARTARTTPTPPIRPTPTST